MANKKVLILFSLYFIAILSAFFAHPLELKTDIMDIIPKNENEVGIADEAVKNISKEYTNKINVLFGADDLDKSIEAGKYFESQIKDMDVQFEVHSGQKEIMKLISEYSSHLLSDSSRQNLQNENYNKATNKAYELLYSPVNANPISLEKDPFFLVSDFMMNLGIIKSGFFPSKDVLSSNFEKKSYAYMIISLDKEKAFAPTYLLPNVEKVFKAKEKTNKKFPEVNINLSGVPVHGYFATSNSLNEMNIISIASILSIILVSYLMFKSLNCFFYALITIGISFTVAFCLTVLLFGQVHAMTLVFGASLIGLCIDYHIHYFVERGIEQIKRAIRISLTTSLLGFVVMMITGIGIINQMAVFAIIGLINAYLIIRFIYPIILKNAKISEVPEKIVKLERKYSEAIRKIKPVYLFLLAIFFCGGILMTKTNDTIKNLYTPEPQLLKAEILFAKVSNMGSAPIMMIVSGESEQEVLEKEETLRAFLEAQIISKNISSYKAISQIIPSKKRQEENYNLIGKLYDNKLKDYAEDTGLKIEQIMENYKQQKGKLISLSEVENHKIFSALKGLLVKGEKFASIVLVENVKNKSELEQYENATFIDKIGELSKILKHSREKATFSLLAVIAIIFCFTGIYYGFRTAIRIMSPSLLAVIITMGTLGYCGVEISLFHILALFLIVCFGIDYSIFRLETRGQTDYSGVAVMISYVTTLASFGALAFTSFAVTQALGIVLCIGISLSYLLSPIVIKE